MSHLGKNASGHLIRRADGKLARECPPAVETCGDFDVCAGCPKSPTSTPSATVKQRVVISGANASGFCCQSNILVTSLRIDGTYVLGYPFAFGDCYGSPIKYWEGVISNAVTYNSYSGPGCTGTVTTTTTSAIIRASVTGYVDIFFGSANYIFRSGNGSRANCYSTVKLPNVAQCAIGDYVDGTGYSIVSSYGRCVCMGCSFCEGCTDITKIDCDHTLCCTPQRLTVTFSGVNGCGALFCLDSDSRKQVFGNADGTYQLWYPLANIDCAWVGGGQASGLILQLYAPGSNCTGGFFATSDKNIDIVLKRNATQWEMCASLTDTNFQALTVFHGISPAIPASCSTILTMANDLICGTTIANCAPIGGSKQASTSGGTASFSICPNVT